MYTSEINTIQKELTIRFFGLNVFGRDSGRRLEPTPMQKKYKRIINE